VVARVRLAAPANSVPSINALNSSLPSAGALSNLTSTLYQVSTERAELSLPIWVELLKSCKAPSEPSLIATPAASATAVSLSTENIVLAAEGRVAYLK